jgi:aryl-alcohol dehydrogenase-like predicted oxidoreductase
VLAQGKDIVPIPGTKRRKYLEENVAASSVHFSDEELRDIGNAFPVDVAAGTRYPEAMMRRVNV